MQGDGACEHEWMDATRCALAMHVQATANCPDNNVATRPPHSHEATGACMYALRSTPHAGHPVYHRWHQYQQPTGCTNGLSTSTRKDYCPLRTGRSDAETSTRPVSVLHQEQLICLHRATFSGSGSQQQCALQTNDVQVA